MFADESVNITQTIQNVKDISKIFTDFSKTFTLPASKTNNKIFEHYYNYNIVNGFDARTKKNSYIELNHKPFTKGKIKLEGVDLKENKPYAYRITFFGNTVDLKDLLGEDTLSSLDWLNKFNQTYSAAAVRTGLTTGYNKTVEGVTYNKAVVAPLITHTTRLYYNSDNSDHAEYPDPNGGNLYPHGSHHHGVYYEELKYALKLHLIVKAIEENYGIQFSEDFFASDNPAYYDLYFWLHRKKGKAFDSSTVTYQVINFPLLLGEMIGVNCYPDKLLIFGQTRGITYNLVITSTTANPYTVIIKKDGEIFDQKTVTAGSTSLQGILTNSSTGYTVFIQTGTSMTNVVADWQLESIQYAEEYNYTSDQFTIPLTQEFIITEQIPDIKVIDFLTGVFKMFNLTAYEKDGIIIVRTLDSFYESSTTTWDITDYVDVNTGTVDTALPYKRIDFKYENLDTKLSKQHKQISLNGWGTNKYDGGDKFDAGGDIYSVVAPFEHMKYERLIDLNIETIKTPQVGWFVDDNNDPYYGKPLLTYAISVTGDEIRFLNTETGGGGTFNDITTYYIPSNSVALSAATSTDNIHFNLEVNEYTFTNDFTNTLFNKYYNTYISQVFNSKRRITKAKAFLPINFLINYSLADQIKIGDKVYIINSINSNLLNGESNLELLNVVGALNGGETPSLLDATVSTLAGTSTDTTFTMNGQVTFEGLEPYTERGFYWVQGTGSPISGTKVVDDGSGVSAYSATVTGRLPETTYSYIAYVINNGTTKYGSPARQVTTAETLSTPVVVTNETTNIGRFTATFNGVIVDVGEPPYTEKGFVWVLGTGTPTTSNNKQEVDGTSAGSYSNTYSLPSDNEFYTVRAYAINTQGTAYGVKNTFKALGLASVSTLDATNVSETSARLNGNVTYVGNPNYTEGNKGFYWKLGTSTPTAADNIAYADVEGTSSGAYYSSISGLNDGATYSFVAWVTNSQGTTTGGREELTTTAIPLYYSLTRCTDGQTGFRSGQETYEITLPTNENHRVSANGIFYIVTGTTNNPLNGVGTVTDENATGCPEIPPTEYPPSVTTLSADPVGTSTATMNGNITDVGFPAYTDDNKGFIWILGTGDPLSGGGIPPPGTGGIVPVSGTGTGIFSHQLTGLSDGTQYTYRAYASNGVAPDPVYGDTSTFITNLIGYYTLTRCSDNATGFRTGQTVEQISLGTNDRVTASGVSYIVTGTTNNTGVTSVGTVTDTGLSGCPTDLPRTYNVELCSGGVTSTVNYTSDGALANGSAYYDGSNCWEIQTVTTYNAGATSIDGTTIYNSCFNCNNANPQLTAFFSTPVKSFNTVCDPEFPSETYYHDGANPLPQVDDICYTTSNRSTVLPAGYYAINDGFNFIDISNNNGIVDAVGAC